MSKNSFRSISFSQVDSTSDIEIVEKKGIGHPDTLADAIAEEVSMVINEYCINKYGYIPRYNADQVSISGGQVHFDFGSGEVLQKATISIAGNMPYLNKGDTDEMRSTAERNIFAFFSDILPLCSEDLFQVNWQTNNYSVRNSSFFSNTDLQGIKTPLAEDTVVACGFYPYSDLERLTIDIYDYICALCEEFPIGSDTKIMTIRDNSHHSIESLISLGFKALEIRDFEEYARTRSATQKKLQDFVRSRTCESVTISTRVNAADDEIARKGYYLLSGSASEHDKGISGKGNRLSGIMSPFRHNSFETVFGKNPVYHTGKIYNVLSFLLAKKISEQIRDRVDVVMISQLGNPMSSPKATNISTSRELSEDQKLQIAELVADECNQYFTTSSENSNLMKISAKIIKLGNLTQFKI